MGQALFFDIDGTILSEITKKIPDSTYRALERAKKNGHLLFINSGRTRCALPRMIEEMPFDGYLCGCGIYLTYNNPRYNVVVEYILALVCVIFVMWTITEQTVCNLVIGQLCVIMLVQSYYTVDPVTKAVFPKVNTESAFPMVTTGWSGYPSLQADITVYNNQYTYLDKAYDKILSNIGYDENTVLIMWGSYEKGTRAAAIRGIRDTYYWDKKQHKRVMEESKNTCEIKVLYQTDFKELLQQGNIPQRAVLICTPHVLDNEWEATSELWQYYSFDSRHVVSVGESGSVIYYRLYREE